MALKVIYVGRVVPDWLIKLPRITFASRINAENRAAGIGDYATEPLTTEPLTDTRTRVSGGCWVCYDDLQPSFNEDGEYGP